MVGPETNLLGRSGTSRRRSTPGSPTVRRRSADDRPGGQLIAADIIASVGRACPSGGRRTSELLRACDDLTGCAAVPMVTEADTVPLDPLHSSRRSAGHAATPTSCVSRSTARLVGRFPIEGSSTKRKFGVRSRVASGRKPWSRTVVITRAAAMHAFMRRSDVARSSETGRKLRAARVGDGWTLRATRWSKPSRPGQRHGYSDELAEALIQRSPADAAEEPTDTRCRSASGTLTASGCGTRV